jgi:hypothetical protein
MRAALYCRSASASNALLSTMLVEPLPDLLASHDKLVAGRAREEWVAECISLE